MQFDSWLFLFLNLTVLLAVSGFTLILLKNGFKSSRRKDFKVSKSQAALSSLILLAFKKFLVMHRMLKQDNDDDSPFASSLVLI